MQLLKATTISAALIAAPVFAQGENPVVVEGGVPAAIVSYADLDLGSGSGLATLNGRIARAASRLCVEQGRKDLATAMNEAHCFDTAIASAKPQVERAVAERTLHLASGVSSGAIKVAGR